MSPRTSRSVRCRYIVLMHTESVAGWYFRLNGFFTIRNFVLHPGKKGGQRTDADIAGVRFPFRAEFPTGGAADAEQFNRINDRLYLAIAEVKRARCELNGPWTDPAKENMPALLGAIGILPQNEIPAAAASLYDCGVFENDKLYCSLVSVGDEVNTDLATSYPSVPQFTWDEMLRFVHDRFSTYRNQKADHQGWDEVGKELWRLSEEHEPESFVREVRVMLGLHTERPRPTSTTVPEPVSA